MLMPKKPNKDDEKTSNQNDYAIIVVKNINN